jgi:hypothetical protein
MVNEKFISYKHPNFMEHKLKERTTPVVASRKQNNPTAMTVFRRTASGFTFTFAMAHFVFCIDILLFHKRVVGKQDIRFTNPYLLLLVFLPQRGIDCIPRFFD